MGGPSSSILVLTPTFTDTFQRANENPLNPTNYSTATGFGAMQVVSHLCEPASATAACAALFTGSIPRGGQFSSITINAILPQNARAEVNLFGSLSALTTYVFSIGGTATPGIATALAERANGAGSAILYLNSNFSYSAGDTFTIAWVSGTVYLLQNNTLLAAVPDSTFTSGPSGLDVAPVSSFSDVQISKFSAGIAALQDDSIFSIDMFILHPEAVLVQNVQMTKTIQVKVDMR